MAEGNQCTVSMTECKPAPATRDKYSCSVSIGKQEANNLVLKIFNFNQHSDDTTIYWNGIIIIMNTLARLVLISSISCCFSLVILFLNLSISMS